MVTDGGGDPTDLRLAEGVDLPSSMTIECDHDDTHHPGGRVQGEMPGAHGRGGGDRWRDIRSQASSRGLIGTANGTKRVSLGRSSSHAWRASMSSLDSQQPEASPTARPRPRRASAAQPARTPRVAGRKDGPSLSVTVPAGEFKAKCLALMDELEACGGEITITKRGRPVAKLTPYRPRPVPDLRGSILYEAEDAWEPHPEWWQPGPHRLT